MSDQLRSKLAPLAAQLRAQRPVIRRVSQVFLELSDVNAFKGAIRESVAWLARRCAAEIPSRGFDGEPFDLTLVPGANPTITVATEIRGARFWAGRISEPDKSTAQRNWLTEIVLTGVGPLTFFHSRLSNATRGLDEPYGLTRPGVVRQIMGTFSASADNVGIDEHGFLVESNYDFDEFLRLLVSKERTLPIVAISKPEQEKVFVGLPAVMERLGGAVHVAVVGEEASWRLTEKLGKVWSVYNGAVRLYRPGVVLEEDFPRRHPLYLPDHGSDESHIVESLAAEIFPRSFDIGRSSGSSPTFDNIYQLYTEQKSRLSPESDPEQRIREIENENENLKRSLEEEQAAFESLLDEAQQGRDLAEEERNEAWSDNRGLRNKVRALQLLDHSEADAAVDETLNDYAKFDDWCSHHLSGSVIVLGKAKKTLRRYGTNEMRDHISDALLLLKNYYVPMRTIASKENFEAYKNACEEQFLEESACFSNQGNAKNFPAYWVSYQGQKTCMDRHLKYGGGATDLRKYFRIYFFWDPQDQVVVVGHLPTHLDNMKTRRM